MKLKENRYIPAKKDGKFECRVHEVKEGFLFDTASLLIKSVISRINPSKKEIADWCSPEIPVERSQELRVTWIGHATVLIQVAGINIITDPIFGNSSVLFPRIIKPGIPLDKLPPIDVVLISHSHYDHMEKPALRFLAKKHPGISFLVPEGNKRWFDKRKITGVTEISWWQSSTIKGASCSFLPAVHWTQRTMFDRNRSLWGSWMVQIGSTTIYFAGDTARGEHFQAIANEFPAIDLAILPIGPCEPREFMKHAHIDWQEAIQAFQVLRAKQFFPIHWGTFRFGHEPAALPINRLKEGWINLNQEGALHVPKAGRPILINCSI